MFWVRLTHLDTETVEGVFVFSPSGWIDNTGVNQVSAMRQHRAHSIHLRNPRG